MKISPEEVVFLVNPHAGTEPPATLTRELDRHDPPIAYFLTESKEAVPAFFATTAKRYRCVVPPMGGRRRPRWRR